MSEAAIDPDQSAEYVLLYPQPHIRNHRPVIAAGWWSGRCLHGIPGERAALQPILNVLRLPHPRVRPEQDAAGETLALNPSMQSHAVSNDIPRLQILVSQVLNSHERYPTFRYATDNSVARRI